ncbi:MAG TPA: hypothetical protein VJP77_08855 [Planctomycetota bacterium]|nr:hypothetical protein [Planctomycetota bacterium]
MKIHPSLACAGLAAALAAPAAAQSVQVHAVQPDPTDADRVWVVNRDNDSVSLVDVPSGQVVNEIAVGTWPRSLAFNADGTKLLVANQRGNVSITTNFVTPFTGTEIRGSISVIDVATQQVVQTLTDVGCEPYGVALAPNGMFFVVSAIRSSELRFLDAATLAEVHVHEFPWNFSFIPSPLTIADLDGDQDGVPDLGHPRGFAMTDDSARLFVTHTRSDYVSVVDLTLDGNGLPTGSTTTTKIDTNEYPFHPINNPVTVQTIASQGIPRFFEDIALTPDGSRAVTPHLLHNLNHDVNHNFGPSLPGAFANRVYPALSVLDAVALSYGQPADTSNRLHHELADPAAPAEYVPFGGQGWKTGNGGVVTLGGTGEPVLGGHAHFTLTGGAPGNIGVLWLGAETSIPLQFGTLHVLPQWIQIMNSADGGFTHTKSQRIPNDPSYDGMVASFQAAQFQPNSVYGLSNGLRVVLGTQGYGLNNLGHRMGHPHRVLFNADGTKLLVLNRGSEDVFLYDVTGSDMQLVTVFPPRHDFVERAAFDLNSPLGDEPLGWTMVADAATPNDDALVYIVNETTRSLSTLRVDFDAGVITQEAPQIVTITGADKLTQSQRIGQELFEDASRTQTAGNFNNSCASCHFEGADDGNSWRRPAGPRTTMPVYGGPLLTGLILWKGVRINFGETGPMFGGENGGHGVLSDAEQQGLNDYHKVIPVPLNPFFDPLTNDLTGQAQFGKDLFFGTNDSGMNRDLRRAGCGDCHPNVDAFTLEVRGYTADFIDPAMTDTLDYGYVLDTYCFTLQENIAQVNIRNVNSAVNSDDDGDGFPDVDKNNDGYSDLEGYTPLDPDTSDNFTRDDPNSYPCPADPDFDPLGPKKLFERAPKLFSIPTKLGVVHTGPYMHDNSLISLRSVVDPAAQMFDPVHGSAAYPTTFKWYNEFHDVRGHQDLVQQSSKVQLSLVSDTVSPTQVEADIEAILAYVQSL